MLRSHKPLILNWVEAREQVSLGAVTRMTVCQAANSWAPISLSMF